MGTSGNQTLIDTAHYINNQKRLPESQREFQVVSKSPEGFILTADNAEPVDLYFKPELTDDGKRITRMAIGLVISPEFLELNNITDEELAVIIAKKTRLSSGLRSSLRPLIEKQLSISM